MGGWPMPLWPAWRLQESHQKTAVESGSSLQSVLASARIISSAGDLDEARRKLSSWPDLLNGRKIPAGELRQIIAVALLLHDQALALHLLGTFYPAPRHIGFDIGDHDHSVMIMQTAPRSVMFSVSKSLFAHDHGEILLQRFVDIYPLLSFYIGSPWIEEGTVAINLGDAGHAPGLTFCDWRPGYFLIPDSMFMDAYAYKGIREHFAQRPIPWEQRSSVAFWRGTTTGQATDPQVGWRSLPRIRLCEIAADNPDLVDAGITKVIQINSPDANDWIANAGLLRPHVPPESFQQYKYQIDIDGNTTSWPGLFIKLLSGSVVLKVPPRDGLEQWYYDRLKPWGNFIPLEPDMSDLPSKVRWLRQNDRAARTIAEAGLRLAEDLTYEKEIGRAAPTIAAAIRNASRRPVLDLTFAVEGTGVAHLREGWLPPERDGVATAGFQSRVDLPRPCGIGGFVLGIEVSPATPNLSQRITVCLDGEVLEQQYISARKTIYVPLSRRMLCDKPVVAVTLLHPDAAAAASALSPADTRILGIRLHRIFALGSERGETTQDPEMLEVLLELRGLDDPKRQQDLNGPLAFFPKSSLSPIYTCHKTLAYADVQTGCLLHGPADCVPHNLFLAASNDVASIIRLTDRGHARIVRVKPEGTVADEVDRAALNPEGYADRFEVVRGGEAADNRMGLMAAGVLMCAEESGNFRLSRRSLGTWELFESPRDSP